MRIITVLLLLVITNLAHAEVYKCHAPSKQITYQSTPCSPDTADQNIVNIPKLDAHQLEEAENRLKATEAERQALDKAEQDRQEAVAAQWRAEAPLREAAAARQEAAAARQEAEAARQAAGYRYPIFISNPNYGYHNGQNRSFSQRFSVSPAFDPMFSPSPTPNPLFSPNATHYPPPYIPSPVFPSNR